MFKKYTFGIALLTVTGIITFLAVLISFRGHPGEENTPIVLDRTTTNPTPTRDQVSPTDHQETTTTPSLPQQAPAPVAPPEPDIQHYPANDDTDDPDNHDDIETSTDDD